MHPHHASVQTGEPALASPPCPATPGWDVAGRNLYLIGIGGCGMSGLARLLARSGARVSGSDLYPSPFTDTLERDGVPVGFEQDEHTLPADCELVIASAAIKPGHPEFAAAKARAIPTMTYAEALGRSMSVRTGVAIAGTHGKSTTTAMLGWTLQASGLDPTVIVGANCPQLGGGFRLGADRVPAGPLAGRPGLLLAESCEFNRSFHHHRPLVAAITSVEADHLDIYGSIDAVVEAFAGFARLIPPEEEGGTLLIAHDGAHRREVTAGLACRVLTIGFSPAADFSIQYDPQTRRTGLVRRGEGLLAAWITPLPGEHNAQNAATAAALAILLGADPDAVGPALSDFGGLARRMQLLGERRLARGGTVRVWDDYGHHPTEVESTLRALRNFEGLDSGSHRQAERRLICVFQPHQHSRTRFLLDEFATAFSAADLVIVPHIYFVRDSDAEKGLVSATDLVDRLRSRGQHALHLYPFEEIVEHLDRVCRDGDVLVVMGAGPVDAVAKGFLAREAHA